MGAVTAISSALGLLKGGANPTPVAAPADLFSDNDSDTALYVGLGIFGFILVLIILYFLLK